MFEDGDGDTPPGKGRIEASSQQPGTKEVPDLGGFITSLFGGEDAGNPGKVNAAKGNGENGCPFKRTER